MVVDQTSGQIICTAFGVAEVHDFRLFKTSQVAFGDTQLCLVALGYQGIAKLHTLSCTPTKKTRGTALPQIERQHNRLLASLRVVGEHINRKLKIFRILAERYRNRRQRFGVCVLI